MAIGRTFVRVALPARGCGRAESRPGRTPRVWRSRNLARSPSLIQPPTTHLPLAPQYIESLDSSPARLCRAHVGQGP